MIFAVACNGSAIAPNFEECETFNIFAAEGDDIKLIRSEPNPQVRARHLPLFLSQLGAECIICNMIEESTANVLQSRGMKMAVFIEGDAEDAVRRFISGEIKETMSLCEYYHKLPK